MTRLATSHIKPQGLYIVKNQSNTKILIARIVTNKAKNFRNKSVRDLWFKRSRRSKDNRQLSTCMISSSKSIVSNLAKTYTPLPIMILLLCIYKKTENINMKVGVVLSGKTENKSKNSKIYKPAAKNAAKIFVKLIYRSKY